MSRVDYCNAVYAEAPKTVTDKLQRVLNAAMSLLVFVLQTVTSSLYLAVVSTYNGRRAFSIAGPTVWNSLPDELRDLACSSDSFKQFLKTILFSLY